ncbi:MAG: tyrosine-type recombinase/integrase [Huintestinicola sp.]|uniref:tyrosine-type recombinase/integrase n=1 Tax=Huintestinicola sp. TaxID=2981661 RepID=UPI003F10EA24
MPRRGENIYKRRDGRWEGRIMLPCGEKSRYKSFYAASYSEVKKKMRDFSPEKQEAVTKDGEKTLSCYAETWLESVKMRCKLSTYNKYKAIWHNHIEPDLGSCKINAVTSDTVGRLIMSKEKLSPATRTDILCVMKMILQQAQTEGCVTASLRHLNIRQTNRSIRVLSLSEQKILISYLTKGDDLCKIGTYLSLCTGIRIGELCALKKKNISFTTNTLHICGTMQRLQVEGESVKTRIMITEPKSRKAVRDIPLPEFIAGFFREHYETLSEEAYLLSGEEDISVEPRVMEYKFRSYIAECKLENVHFHTLRHTFATRCVENGFEIKALSEILGHENVNITLNRYVHSSSDFKRSNMEKLRSLI